jgi:hypothetical protein
MPGRGPGGRIARVAGLVLVAAVALALPACTGRGTGEAASPPASGPGGEGSLGSSPTPSLPPQSPPPSTGGPAVECTLSMLKVEEGHNGGASGHRSMVLVFTNTGSATCSMRGYPGVAALNASGKQIAQAKRTTSGYLGGLASGQPPSVALAPGAKSSAMIEASAFDPDTGAACTPYAGLLVTPPDETHSARLPWPGDGCDDLQIHPVVPGTTGQAG